MNNEILIKNIDFINYIIQKYVSDNYIDDFTQEIYTIILEMKSEKIKDIIDKKYDKYFIVKLIKNQWFSSTSSFYYKYKKNKFEEYNENDIKDSVEYDESNIEEIEEIINSLYWYERNIYCMYYKLFEYNKTDGRLRDIHCDKDKSTFRRIEELTDIPFSSVAKTINSINEDIKTKIKKIYL